MPFVSLPLFLGGVRGGKKNSTVLLPSPALPLNREGVDGAQQQVIAK